jgi:hypothetical protein
MPKFLIAAGLAWCALSACALGPVESDPQKAAERSAAMRQDCYARGGTWSEEVRTCVGADPTKR